MSKIVCRIIEVCAFKFSEDRPWYLLLRRSKREKIYPNIWQLISGLIEEHEKTYEAALREFAEETSLSPKKFWVVPYINSFYDPDYDAVNISPLFLVQVEDGVEPKLSREHYEWGWFLYEQALEKLVWPGQREGLRIVHEYIVGGKEAGKLIEMKLPQNAPPHSKRDYP